MGLLILQPRANGFRSGGYAYNENLGRLLQARELGGCREASRRDLVSMRFPAESTVLVDSLFLQSPLTIEESRSLPTEGIRYYLLLHLLPFDDPTASDEEKARIRVSIERWLPVLSGVVVTGYGAAREWCHHFPATFEPIVAPPAIYPVARHPGEGNSGLRLLSVGTLCPRKNQLAILEALKRSETDTWRWDLVGEADHQSAYVREFLSEVKSRRWEDRVLLHGSLSQEQCDTFLSRAGLFVSAARFESFGMATATSLASGVPTLTFRTGDVERWVPDGDGSFHVDTAAARKFEELLLRLLHRKLPLPCPAGVELPCRSWEDTLSLLLGGLAKDFRFPPKRARS